MTQKYSREQIESYATALTRARRWAALLDSPKALLERMTREIDKADAALRAQQEGPAAEPAGWKLVPVEPTEAMHVAAVRTAVRCTGNDDFPPRVWRAMLAAAPTQEGPAASAEGGS